MIFTTAVYSLIIIISYYFLNNYLIFQKPTKENSGRILLQTYLKLFISFSNSVLGCYARNFSVQTEFVLYRLLRLQYAVMYDFYVALNAFRVQILYNLLSRMSYQSLTSLSNPKSYPCIVWHKLFLTN